MSLFRTTLIENLLPYDGTAKYFGPVIKLEDADDYFQKLINLILWRQDEVVIYGKRYVTRRKTAWHGDKEFDYTYSGMTRTALPWTTELKELKNLAEQLSGATYNSCLLNLYHDGHDGMSWHSDNEKMLEKNTAIASMSFGAERKFSFRHNQTKETRSIVLEHGSLLVMKDQIQQHWLHALPKSTKVKSARVNLTFRTIAD
jgi:alkylated DNA repair dioxygenase AlkB